MKTLLSHLRSHVFTLAKLVAAVFFILWSKDARADLPRHSFANAGPYCSYAYPRNTMRYGFRAVVFGRFDQYSNETVPFKNKVGTYRKETRYPGYQFFVFAGFTDPGFRSGFRWMETGFGFSPFWLRPYAKGIRGGVIDGIREFSAHLHFSASRVFDLHTGQRDFFSLRADYLLPKSRAFFRFDIFLFYSFAAGLPTGETSCYAPHQAGVLLYIKPFIRWRG